MTGGIESESTDPKWKPMTEYSQASFSSPEQMRALADGVAEEPLETWVSKALPALRAAADEVGRLRAVIENAPHAEDCWLREDPDEGVLPEHRKCTCWKGDAL